MDWHWLRGITHRPQHRVISRQEQFSTGLLNCTMAYRYPFVWRIHENMLPCLLSTIRLVPIRFWWILMVECLARWAQQWQMGVSEILEPTFPSWHSAHKVIRSYLAFALLPMQRDVLMSPPHTEIIYIYTIYSLYVFLKYTGVFELHSHGYVYVVNTMKTQACTYTYIHTYINNYATHLNL